MSAMPKVGEFAPEFELRDDTGTVHRLADRRGHFTVVYFYPADDTPGCTKEACSFRDNDAAFKATWAPYSARIRQATLDRLDRQRATGSLRADVDIEQLAGYLELVWEGLIAHLAAGLPTDRLDGVLDVVEGAMRLKDKGAIKPYPAKAANGAEAK